MKLFNIKNQLDRTVTIYKLILNELSNYFDSRVTNVQFSVKHTKDGYKAKIESVCIDSNQLLIYIKGCSSTIDNIFSVISVDLIRSIFGVKSSETWYQNYISDEIVTKSESFYLDIESLCIEVNDILINNNFNDSSIQIGLLNNKVEVMDCKTEIIEAYTKIMISEHLGFIRTSLPVCNESVIEFSQTKHGTISVYRVYENPSMEKLFIYESKELTL